MKAMLFALFAGLLMLGCGEDAQKGTVQKETRDMNKALKNLQLILDLARVQQKELEEKKKGLEDEINGRILRMVADMSELELQQLDSQLNSQIEQLSHLIENQVRVIPKESNVGKKPILVILGASEFTIGAFNGEQRTLQVTPATYYRQLGGALASYEKNRNFFVYFFRPSACKTVVSNVPGRNGTIKKNLFGLLCDPKNNLTSMLGFKYGFEPIHEEATVLFTNKNPDVFEDLLFMNVLPVQVRRTDKGPNETIVIEQPDSRVRNRPTAPVELTEEADYELIRESEQLENSLLDLQDDHVEMIEDLEDEADRMRKERLGLEEEVARLETILEHQELFQELKKKPYRKVSLPQQKDSKKKPLPVIVAHGKMYPVIKFGIGITMKNEDGLTWNLTTDQRIQIKVDPSKGIDPENEQSLQNFLSSVRDAPRKVRQDFFLNLFVFSDSESFGVFNKIRDEAVLRDLDYNWLPISELPLMLKADNVPWKTQ
jgi:hypothetical protein